MTVKPSQRPMREAPANRPPTRKSFCPDGTGHHWRIAEPQGATSAGACKKCGATKQFRNGAEDFLDWTDTTSSPRGLGRLEFS